MQATNRNNRADLERNGKENLSRVLMMPGIINPSRLSYLPLTEYLQGKADLRLKELEVYRQDGPPDGYSVATEANGIFAEADMLGWQSFHLVGYSAGGIAALVAITQQPRRLLSVVLIEPFGTGMRREASPETAFLRQAGEAASKPERERVKAFLPVNLREGVDPPVLPEPLPDWMSLRPAGIAALVRSATELRISPDQLSGFSAPVLVVYGGLSHPAWDDMAATIAAAMPSVRVSVYPHLHHLSPPQRAEPLRFSEELVDFWANAS